MRIWAATRDMNKIIKEVVMDFPAAHSEDEWNAVLGDICHELDLSRPVLLKKHLIQQAAALIHRALTLCDPLLTYPHHYI